MENERAIQSIGDLAGVANAWELDHPEPGNPEWVWYRGQANAGHEPVPGVLRQDFLECAERMSIPRLHGERGLNLEMRINDQFRRQGAALFDDPDDLVGIYLTAQHHGLPTRLLDWTTNPLTALYFAVCKDREKPGKLFVSRANMLGTGQGSETQRSKRLIETVRYLFGQEAEQPEPDIIAFQPDWKFRRMQQQSSPAVSHRFGGCTGG